MSDVDYTLIPVKSKPSRKYRKGSKYDPILDAFILGEANLVQVSIVDMDANYLRLLLNKRIEDRNLGNIKVSVINNVVYLEKS